MDEDQLAAYFARIGYEGEREPTLATLNALSRAHVSAIPFENLDVMLRRGISLREDDVARKLIDEQRGGYCFEQNTLFHRVLTALGFEARLLSARVRMGRERTFTPPRTHTFLRVELAGESWLADVGVGGLSLTSALRLEPDTVQSTPHEPRRLVCEEGLWFHQAMLGDAWMDVCEFTLEEMPPIDREVANWFTSTHPKSHFRTAPLVALALPNGGRVTLRGDELRVRTGAGLEVETLRSSSALLDALDSHFGLRFPAGTHFD